MYGRQANQVYELRFRNPQALARAFGEVLECQFVEACWVDEARGTLSFRSDPESARQVVRRAAPDPTLEQNQDR